MSIAISYIVFLYPSISSNLGAYFDKSTPKVLGVERLAYEYRKGCPKHRFKSIQILSRNPDVVLIDGFLTKVEAQFLINAAYVAFIHSIESTNGLSSEPLFRESTVVDNSKGGRANLVQKKDRDSSSAYMKLPSNPPESDDDVVINCIEQRAAAFQGHVPVENLEPLQVVR